ncbi:MAG: DUF1700 domain-containing protein [Lachnospiraceae bacterium]|jgi:uncharacterized membrane protein|nr:DUF1700 domain-containing protein [Lachnospiraceae bacterium]
MTQREFLDTLKRALNGQVPPHVVTENLSYYDNYIYEEIRKGRLERDVLEELGDPRLLARTIIDAEESSRKSRGQKSSRYSDIYEDDYAEDAEPVRGAFHVNKWVVFGVLFLILFLVCTALFFTFRTAFSLLFSFRGVWVWAIILLVIYSLSRRR